MILCIKRVCDNLGVNDLSGFFSDDELLQAVVHVVSESNKTSPESDVLSVHEAINQNEHERDNRNIDGLFNNDIDNETPITNISKSVLISGKAQEKRKRHLVVPMLQLNPSPDVLLSSSSSSSSPSGSRVSVAADVLYNDDDFDDDFDDDCNSSDDDNNNKCDKETNISDDNLNINHRYFDGISDNSSTSHSRQTDCKLSTASNDCSRANGNQHSSLYIGHTEVIPPVATASNAAITTPPSSATNEPLLSNVPSSTIPYSSSSTIAATKSPTMMSIQEVYACFWELTYKLFLYVCNPYRQCEECLCVAEGKKINDNSMTGSNLIRCSYLLMLFLIIDIVQLLNSQPLLPSPLTALALDAVIQVCLFMVYYLILLPYLLYVSL